MKSGTSRWLSWLPWTRSRQEPCASGAARAPGSRPRLFGRRRTEERTGSAALDPALELAREWLVARGARLVRANPDTLAGILPDGTSVRYTCAPVRTREEPQTVLLAPGSDGLETLQGAIERRGTSLALRVDAPAGRAVALAHAAFVTSPAIDVPDVSAAGDGRFVVIGASKGVRECVVESRREVRALEYSVRVRVAAPSGRRDELIRVALDAASGEPIAPLDEALLRQARAEQRDAAHAFETAAAPEMLATVERLLDAPTRASARLARAQALPEYQRRQNDIQALYARLLQETPEQGAALLGARERELRRLAEARAVEVRLEVVNIAAVITELVRVHVRLTGGGELAADVDPCRARVLAPQCTACGRAWRVGARCAEGHVTCLDCQQVCRHCDKRRCPHCSGVAFTACPSCGEVACDACVRSAARGRHHAPRSPLETHPAPAPSPIGSLPGERSLLHEAGSGTTDASASPEDLTVADLDAMSGATWQVCLRWLLEGMGYTVERALEGPDRVAALVCRRTALPQAGAAPARVGDIVLVSGYRPASEMGTAPPPGLAREMLDLARQVPGARVLLVTTARAGDLPEPLRTTDSVALLDRNALAQALADACGAYRRERHAAEQRMDRLAATAQAARATLMRAAGAAASALERRLAADIGAMHEHEGGGSWVADDVRSVEQAALTLRQALIALETLMEEWEGCFAPTASREGALTLVADEAAIAPLGDRAHHLASALEQGCSAFLRIADGNDPLALAWRNALTEELQLRCLSLERRAAALDPTAWRSHSAAHDTQAAQQAIEALAASGRAALRAQRLRDELASRRPGARDRSRR